MKPRANISFTIKIPIPQAVSDLLEDIKYKAKKVAFKLRPYRCGICSTKLFVKNSQYEYFFDGGKRLLVENNVWNKPPICRSCLISELESKEWTPRMSNMLREKGLTTRSEYRFWSTKKCDITGKAVRSYKDVEIVPFIDMLFCTTAWNHEYVSKEAVIEAIRYGKVRTSRWGVWKKTKMAPMNEKGLFIKDNGELL